MLTIEEFKEKLLDEIKYRSDTIKVNKLPRSEVTVNEYNRSVAILRSLLWTYVTIMDNDIIDIEYHVISRNFGIDYPAYMKENGSFEE
jgi:hypothetical protein